MGKPSPATEIEPPATKVVPPQTPDRGRSAAEREVLRVLWSYPERPLVRSEIHKRIPQQDRPTPGRIGQILSALYDEELVTRSQGKAQGNPKASFYSLSDLGRKLGDQLDFKHAVHLQFAPSEEELKTYLTRKSLARKSMPGRILGVYAYRGGLGTTTLTAHVAKGLAQSLATDQQVLLVDMDFHKPGLPSFFPRSGSDQQRGLGGLLIDSMRRPSTKRALWLRGALQSAEYSLLPFPDNLPNLTFLPSGLAPGAKGLTSSEQAEAHKLLETQLRNLLSGQTPQRPASNFLTDLREVFLEVYAKTVIEVEAGHQLSTMINIDVLADQLILLAQFNDTSPPTIAGIRAVLVKFIQRSSAQKYGRVDFLFRLQELNTKQEMNRWIERHILNHANQPEASLPADYRTESLPFDLRLAKPPRESGFSLFDSGDTAHIYRDIIQHLTGSPTQNQPREPTEFQLLEKVFDPQTPESDWSIATGQLQSIPFSAFLYWLARYTTERGPKAVPNQKTAQFFTDYIKNTTDEILRKLIVNQPVS